MHLFLLKLFSATLVGLSIFFLEPQQASAKTISQILQGTDIKPSDMEIIKHEASQLYESASKTVGDQREWSNPETGNSGLVEILDVSEQCVRLRHRITVKRATSNQEYLVRRCKNTDGNWRLAPE